MTDSKSPFRASFLKIERAQRHILELEAVVREYLASEPAKVTTSSQPLGECPPELAQQHPGMKWFHAFSFQMHINPPPEVLSAILGDIFHNLRSALDLMASALVRLNNEPDDEVAFPFAGDADGLEKMIARRNFDKAGAAAVTLLKEWKPYKGGNLELRAIHDLNVQDKHRQLVVQRVSVSGPIIDTRPEDGSRFKIVGDPNKPSDVKLVFPADSTLSEHELISTLHKLVDLTASIVKSFEALSAPSG